MDVNGVVAANVRAIREGKRLTLDAAAAATGVSRSMLAQIEKGEVNPTISVLWKIANGYKVSFTSLVEDRRGPVDVRRGREIQPLEEDGGRYLNYPLFPFEEDKGFESYRIVIREGGGLEAQPHLKGAREYVTVFSGALELTVEGTSYRLEKGDAIRFQADVPHAYRGAGPGDTELHMLIYYQG